MVRGWIGRSAGLVGLVVAVCAIVAWAAPAAAQSTGMIKGKVVDGSNQVVEGAEIVIESKDGGNRRFKVKTNKKGEYLQIGLQPGMWTLSASKEGVGVATAEVRITLGATEQIDLTLGKAVASKEDQAKQQALSKIFAEGVAASQAGNNDVAIAKFSEALASQPDCYACQYNIGLALAAKQEWPKAEEALLAASKMKPDAPEPYNQLANVYNAQKQFEKAAAMAQEATKRAGAGGAGAASPETLFNQGVVLWNASKIPEAKAAFEAAVKAKPDYAEAHYWIGMGALNQGDMAGAAAAFDNYLKYAPDGPKAAEVKGILSQIKK